MFNKNYQTPEIVNALLMMLVVDTNGKHFEYSKRRFHLHQINTLHQNSILFMIQKIWLLCDISEQSGNPLSTNAKWFSEREDIILDVIFTLQHSFFSFYSVLP